MKPPKKRNSNTDRRNHRGDRPLAAFPGADPPLATNGGRVVLIDSSIIGNEQDDIGIYSLDAPPAITNGIQIVHVLYKSLMESSD